MTTIYHNPRCSKSRATLELLVNHGIEPTVVLYLEQPPDAETLKSITRQLDCSISDIIRKGEEEYTALGLAKSALTEDELVKIVAQNPKLLERPIVVNNGKAAIGRPPENVLSIL
jgi:arsenate reductase